MGTRKPVYEIQAPVDCSYFDSEQVHADLHFGKKKTIKIVSVGNVNPAKGFEYFLKMATSLNKKYSNVEYFIIGAVWESQKSYYRYLSKISEQNNLKNVTFLGDFPDVRPFLKAADIYVCSSIAEASPLSVWEAMAMKKAIVATDVGDINKFIQHGSNGYIVSTKNPTDLAHYVAKLIDAPELRVCFGKKARETAITNLDISIVARNHKNAYQKLAASY